MTTIYIVRHGEAEHNIQKQFGLIPDSQLTDKGKQQAMDVSDRLKNVVFDHVFSSDFVRAKQTAELIALERKLVVTTTQALRERSYGKMNGRTVEQMKAELQEIYDAYQELSNKEKFSQKLVKDMESVEEALSRTLIYLRELAIAYPSKTILLVSHNTIIRSLLIHLGYADHHEIDSKCIANTAYIKIETDGTDFFLKDTFGITKYHS